MQYPVPQYIDVEDRIIGPLTLKQFIYLVAGGGIALGLFFLLNFAAFLVLSIPIILFFLALAFYKINGRPFLFFILSTFSYVTRARARLWKRAAGPELVAKTAPGEAEATAREKEARAVLGKALPLSSLKKLSFVLDTEGSLPERAVAIPKEEVAEDEAKELAI